MLLKQTDLHVHVLQCLYPEDLYELAKDCYNDINWNRFNFLTKYEKIFGIRLNPVEIFNRAVSSGSIKEIEEVSCYKFKGNGNFDEFSIKSYFAICITGYYFDKDDPETVLQCIVQRHKREGLRYVEYRNGFGGSGDEWKTWHARFARYFKEASTDTYTAKYIVRLGRYSELKEIIDENPDLVDTIVGVDFSGKEKSPETLKSFYDEVNYDRSINPHKTVDVVVHIGENFFDISLESAIRWCHLSAQYGAKRLAHCIVLGLDPLIAVSRKEDAHSKETVEERIAQIEYDIHYSTELHKYGVGIDVDALEEELVNIKSLELNDVIVRHYDEKRLYEVSRRQDFVLDALKERGTIVEVCPTSNLCISGIGSYGDHPFFKLYNSGVNIAICTDDPGVFKSSLSDEVDFLVTQLGFTYEDLLKRLGNPYRFRLKGE